MNREIKFRAWDSTRNIMADVTEWSLDGLYTVWINGRQEGSEEEEWEDAGDITLMQYTGLKDKNGKEIYEGDIVQLRDHNRRKSGILILEWPFSEFYDSEQPIISEEVEVIGNVHENPELWKKNKR